jgi:quercetin dioxygenase-like cupin family protein
MHVQSNQEEAPFCHKRRIPLEMRRFLFMRLLTWPTALLFALTLTVPALAQDNLDSVKVDPAHHKVVLENDQVRVVRWVIPVGDKTLMHSHPESLIINLTDYSGRVTTPDGKTFEVHAKAGSVSWRQALTHAVENIGSQPMEGLIVEPKSPASRPTGGN